MTIQWYPGHMAQARRLIKDNLRLVDVVLELVDARIPISSRNPDSPRIFQGRPSLIVMNKADLADPALTWAWKKFFQSKGEASVALDSKTGKGLGELRRVAIDLSRPRVRDKGLKRPVRVMVVGIPNVGKSSLLNRLVGRRSAAVGDRPGITQGPQWVRAAEGMELLDTPGVLWPKFDDPQVGKKLAATGAIKEEVFDRQGVAEWVVDLLDREFGGLLEARYGLLTGQSSAARLEAIGWKRGLLAAGGRVDIDRAVSVVLDDFRSGRLGRITLDRPEEEGFGRRDGES